jgi:hypothetical protein
MLTKRRALLLNSQKTGAHMKLPRCVNCKSFLCFFDPQGQDVNKFWHRCDACGVVNELAIDASSSGESKAVFKAIGTMVLVEKNSLL